MNPSPHDVDNTQVPTRHYARQDERQRGIVDHGIEMQQSANTMSAVEYLRSCDIGPQVIARVLLEPARRRSSER